METPHRPGPAGSDTDAGGRAWQPSRGRLAIAVLLAVAGCTALFLMWMPSWTGPAPAEAAAPAPAPAPVVAAAPAPGQPYLPPPSVPQPQQKQ